jgi:hypothetical protein
MHSLLLLVLALVFARAQQPNSCQSSGSCCTTVDFDSMPGTGGAALQQGYEVAQDGTSPWASMLGVRFAMDAQNVHPGTSYVYQLGLLNTSAIAPQAQWSGLAYTETLLNPRPDGLVLTPADSLGTFEGPIVPMHSRTSFTLHVYLNRSACITSLRLLRSIAFSLRMNVLVQFYSQGLLLNPNQNLYQWSQVQTRTNDINVQVSQSNVDHIALTWTGFGYGALASLSFCLPNAQVDECGICGGNNQCVPPLINGQPCTNASFALPLCRAGHLNALSGSLRRSRQQLQRPGGRDLCGPEPELRCGPVRQHCGCLCQRRAWRLRAWHSHSGGV